MRYEVVDTQWQGEGTHRVLVRSPYHGRAETLRAGVRRAARSADPMGEVRRTHVTGVWGHEGRDAYGEPMRLVWEVYTYRNAR